MLKIYNTLSRKIETFKPLNEGCIKFYTCGPTVYNYAHIGNLCCYTYGDIAVRALEFLGYTVDTLMNLTDIDDKTIRDSQKSGMKLEEFTKLYTAYFMDDVSHLNIQSFKRFKPISEVIPEMILIIQSLLDSKHAYISEDGSVYYDVVSFEKYGDLAHLDTKGMKAGARVSHDEYEKESIADFALWKGYSETDGENFWEAKFQTKEGEKMLKGRPGWHIECSACNLWGYGEQIDIHMGGCDLIFPHHQNEIAQTEAFTGKTFSTYWMHTGHLLVDNKKMSKSAGNFYRLKDIEEKYQDKKPLLYRAFRMMCLQNRYRENFNFTFERLEGAMLTIEGIDNFVKRLKTYTSKNTKIRREFRDTIQKFVQEFVSSLENDIDTVNAMTQVFGLITLANKDMDTGSLGIKEVGTVTDLLRNWDMVMGIIDWTLLEESIIPEDIRRLAQERDEAKKNKNFALSDEIRDKLKNLGYVIIDNRDGYNIEKQ